MADEQYAKWKITVLLIVDISHIYYLFLGLEHFQNQ